MTMPSSASISISARPEIARFGGMAFHVFYDDHIEPHVEVMVKGTKFRFSLLDRKPLPGKAKATERLRQQVQEWLKTEIPGGTRTVNDLVYDQWLRGTTPRSPMPQTTSMTDKAKKQGSDTTRFEIAPTEVVDSYARELYRLLVLIAETSEPDDPEGWAQSCCGSDESLVRIFIAF
jgi:hypothetical protein